MDNSMEQRFIDRLLHALAAMGDYEPATRVVVPEAVTAAEQACEATPHLPIED
jgi:hypothetical protein